MYVESKTEVSVLAKYHSHHQAVYKKEHNDHTLQLTIPYKDYYHCDIANINYFVIPVYI